MKKIIIMLIAPLFILSGCVTNPDKATPVRQSGGYQQTMPGGIPLNSEQDLNQNTTGGVQFPPYNDPNNPNSGQQANVNPVYIPGANTNTDTSISTNTYQPPQPSQPQIQAQTPPIYKPSPDQNVAVQELLNNARDAVASGNLNRASSSLNRAVLIEPRNASIWYDLAQISLHQGKYQLSEQHANKSIGLAGGNTQLVKNNWKIISAVKKAQGDTAGANNALKNAQ